MKEGEEADKPEKDEPRLTSAAETKPSSDEDIAQMKEKAELKMKKESVAKEAAVDKELLQVCS